MLPATLAVGLGLRELLDSHLKLGEAPGRANVGDKAMTVVHALLAGGDCIDDVVRREAPWNRVGCKGPPLVCRSRPVKLGAA
jgi:hypothetical protein